MINLSIIIPCFNEDKNIIFLFEKIEKLLENNNSVEIIIVDNGSTDYTHQKIIDFEQQTKNKVILYSKDTYLNNQYRYFLIKKGNGWKIDKRQWLNSGWKKDYL